MQGRCRGSNGQEVLDILEETDVDVVLLDLSMPVMNGIDCLREIRRRHYDVKVLVLTMYSEQEYVTELMQLGADGYLCKDTLDAELFKGLRAVASGERYLSEREARSLLNGVLAEKKDTPTLSEREQEVLVALVHGHSLSSIGDTLHLSVKTVSTYKTRLMQKLNCKTKVRTGGLCLKTPLDVSILSIKKALPAGNACFMDRYGSQVSLHLVCPTERVGRQRHFESSCWHL